MKKYFIILLAMVFLTACKSEKDPCDIEYQLNEPGGFGRNEVTFLIDDEIIWHSSQLVSGSGSVFGGSISGSTKFLIIQEKLKNDEGIVIKDSLGEPIYLDEFLLQLETKSSINCKNDYFDKVDLRLTFRYFNDFNPKIEEIDMYATSGFIKYGNGLLNNNSLKNITSNVYLNRKDSIIYGTFSGELYGKKRVNNELIDDTIKITDGVFDYKYKSHNFHGRR